MCGVIPLDKVYKLGSRVDLLGGWDAIVDGGGKAVADGGVTGVDCLKGEETGGGGGGGAAGELCPFPKAFRAACIAIEWLIPSLTEACELGGGGGVDRTGGGLGMDAGGGGALGGGAGTLDGGRGAGLGGGGGAEGGVGALDGGGGGGAAADGFRDVIGGGGGFPPLGGGGGARGGRSEVDFNGFGGGLRRFATMGLDGCGGDDSMVFGVGLSAFNLGAVGGFGAAKVGGLGGDVLDISGSEAYEESLSAPVSTPPPVFLNFGMPTPAKIPPS